jgi:2-dehydro-3-deoxygluconokinase
MSPKVVTLGEAMLRLSPADGGRLQEATGLDAVVAGAEANVAAALASLGVPTAWVSALPDNPLGRRVADELRRAGVELEFVEWDPSGRLGLFFVEFGSPPRPTTVWYDRAGSAFSAMWTLPGWALEGADYAVTSGITLALSDSARDLGHDFLDAARAAGARTCLDVNYRERLSSPTDARDLLAPVVADVDVLVCSRGDAERVFSITADSVTDVAVALREQVAPGAELVAITDGDRGAAAASADELVASAGLPTSVVDRIGAGDAFLAGLLWGLLEGGGLERALRYGCALGALACTVAGDQALFTPAEVRAVADEERVLIR